MKYLLGVLFGASLLMAQGNEVIITRHKVSGGQIAYVAGTSVANVTSDVAVTTSAINTTGATLLVLVVQEYSGNPCTRTTPSDSKSNSWTCAGGFRSPDTGASAVLWYSIPTSVGTGHTFTDFGDYLSFTVAAFSGTAASAVLDTLIGAGEDTGSTLQTGALLPSGNNELVITAVVTTVNGGNVSSVDAPFASNLVQNLGWTSVSGAIASAYEIQTTATSRNPTWTFDTSSHEKAAIIAAFKP